MERHVCPPNVVKFGTLPSLRTEIHGVFSIDVLPSMHVVWNESDARSFANEYWRITIVSTTAWQPRGALGKPNVEWNRRV